MSKLRKCLLSFPVSNSRVAHYVQDVWGSLDPRFREFGIEVPSLTVEQFWSQIAKFRVSIPEFVVFSYNEAVRIVDSSLCRVSEVTIHPNVS